MIRTETIKGTGIRQRVIGSRITVSAFVFHLTVGIVVAGFAEDAQLWNAEHRVPAHVETHRATPLKSF